MTPDEEHLKRLPFWLVWNPIGRAPAHKHYDERSAIAEAQRLSRANPGQEFFVMAVSSGWTIPEPDVLQLDIDPNFIPF